MNSRSRRSRLGLGRLGLERVEQLVAARGAVGHRQRDVEREPLGVDVGHHVLDRQPGGLADPLDQVAALPPRAVLGIGGDDDRVRVVLLDGVHRRGVRVGIADLADASIPSERTNPTARSTRAWAASKTESS